MTRICPRCQKSFVGTLDRCPTDGTPLFSAEVLARVGMLLKDHEIQEVIGEGGMGVVYRAQHVVIEKPVAIKVLHDHFARQKEVVEQFIVEAKAASRIRHPNIIDVTDFGTTPDGMVFLVMEYLDGESLEDRLLRVGRLSVFEAVNIVRQVASGLGAAHELGIIHRDLKPANIFLCMREGRRRVVQRSGDGSGAHFTVAAEGGFDFVKLLDFGVAKFLDLGPGAATRAGVVCGTPHYLSPEQAQEKPADERSDIYALGAVFYEMVTGAVPFGGRSMLEILNGHVSGVVVPPSQRVPEAGVDSGTDAVILQCLHKDPARRFTNAEAFGAALRSCVTDRVFLRDAPRLPGAVESGIDLSEATPAARRCSASLSAVADMDGGLDVDLSGNTPPPQTGAASLDTDGEIGGDVPAGEPRFSGSRALLDGADSFGDLDGRITRETLRMSGLRSRGAERFVLGTVVLLLAGAGVLWATRWRKGAVAPDGVAVATVARSGAPAQPAPPPPAPAAPALDPPPAAGALRSAAPPSPVPPAVPAPRPVPPPAAPARPAISVAGAVRTGGQGADHPAAARERAPIEASRSWPPSLAAPPSEPVPTPEASPSPALAPAEPAAAPVDTEALLREAQQAWLRQHYGAAIHHARAVLRADPGQTRAYQIIAACSCALGETGEAQEAITHLDPQRRKLVQSLCERNGVTLE